VVGAAALTSSTTHTIAIAVVAFEVTGQIVLLYPILIGVITAFCISRLMTSSIYHVIVDIKNLPFLPRALMPKQYALKAEDIMNRNCPYLSVNSTFTMCGDLCPTS